MSPLRLLYLTDAQMSAHCWQAGRLDFDTAFIGNAAGHLEFLQYLSRHPNDTYRLLVNVADESFQSETIPSLHGRERARILERKLGQLFFNAPLNAAHSLGHEKTTRKNERVLFTALTRHAFFAPWLDAMAAAGVALSGLHSLPFLTPALLKTLGIEENRCLLLTQHGQHLRQTYVENGRLHFSRLTSLPQNPSPEAVAQTVFNETARLHQYLVSQRILDRNQAITAHLLADTPTIHRARHDDTGSDPIQFVFHDLGACARRICPKQPQADALGDAVFRHLAVVTPPHPQFADDRLRHPYHLKILRRWLFGLGGGVCLGGLILSGALLAESQRIHQENTRLQQETVLTRRHSEEIARALPPLSNGNDALLQIVDRYVELERQSTAPTGLYLEISRALHAAPAIELDSIDWTIVDQAPTDISPTPRVSSPHELALIGGAVRPEKEADPRQTLAVFEQFVSALRSNPSLQVSVQKSPFNIEPGKTLTDNDTHIDAQRPRPFSLKILHGIGS